MKSPPLKIVKNQFRSEISDIIGRDAKEVLKRTPPEFGDGKVEFRNPGIRWLFGLEKILSK